MIDSSLPLLNKKVLVPRGKKQAKSFSQLLKRYGGIPVEIPLIAFRPKMITQKLMEYLNALHTYDWIIFTSNVTVETFLSFVGPEGIITSPKIAVIGKRTEKVVEEKGLRVEFSPTEYVAEAFVEEFLPNLQIGVKILIPKGNLARDYIADSLRKNGAIVDEVVVYETYMPEESFTKLAIAMENQELDILLFTSPSTVDHFMDTIKELGLESCLSGCLIGCIGPSTEKKLKSYNLKVHASPKVYTVEEMIKSMNAYLLEN
ncbi:uroporphyrinogen-III synthase [Neobacillus sp. PS3-40]|uniref:uroporphyrinogen-III synthase n=1 Tax=Neobacillus sp. PS3-40 TaxID=3070679 RepID=UPI0027E0E443|nr:uroporphyrinogen-III synthase [Neobacillus sp. PS3-40]WML45570.1 uroporphyrinogen-III synthase [Neobacillus sp. PS3-40]